MVAATVAQYGVRFLASAGSTELIEGSGAENDPYPRISRCRSNKALVRFTGVPDNSAEPARKLDRPPLHRQLRASRASLD
jgi:hypothetical protein